MKPQSLLGVLLSVFLLSFLGCGGDDDPVAGDGGIKVDSGGGVATGACAPANAIKACGTSCAFDPATLDCQKACDNIATTCAAGTCGTNCTGLNQDVAKCKTGCETTKQLSCTNVSFGCWASSQDCNTVGTCVASKL